VHERFTLENELRRALTNEELTVHYQPEFDVLTNVLYRFEELARWTHPTMGVIPPLQFIPVAEECGLIVPQVLCPGESLYGGAHLSGIG
jgi:EAL domain-containing protein (putative c-di-GMP-specific phosphodiesterase class I)